MKNAASIKGDPAKMVVVGESAGGNFSCHVSIIARQWGREFFGMGTVIPEAKDAHAHVAGIIKKAVFR